jgi:protoheme IX farnesyltransferase
MLPSVVSLHATAVRILAYTVLLWGLTLLFAAVGSMGWIYIGAAVVLGAVFTWMSFELLRDPTTKRAMRLFSYSITYITLLFGAMALDQLVVGST